MIIVSANLSNIVVVLFTVTNTMRYAPYALLGGGGGARSVCVYVRFVFRFSQQLVGIVSVMFNLSYYCNTC